MRDHLLFCCDVARRDPSGRSIGRLEGWCLATQPITAVYLHLAGDQFERLPLGFPRPDVEDAYPHHPGGKHAGFRLTVASPKGVTGNATLLAKVADRWHRVRVELDTRNIQSTKLGWATRLSPRDKAVRQLEDAVAFEQRFRLSLRKQRGLTLRLDIINKCNLRCVMCHFSDEAVFKRPTRQLTTQEFERIFDEIGPSVSHVMLSCGDEPLVSKHLPGIVEYLAREHPQVQIEFCTNAVLMRAPIRDLIMRCGVARLLLSIDAVSKPLLESIRVGCRYEQVIGNIMALRDLRRRCGARRPALVFNFVMMNRNIHEAPAFLRMAHELGADAIDFRHLVPMETYFSPDDLLSNHPAKFNYYRERILDESKRLGVPLYLTPPLEQAGTWAPSVDEPVVGWSDFERVQPDAPSQVLPTVPPHADDPSATWEGSVAEEFSTTFCNRPFSEIMVRDQEQVLPCPWHAKPLGLLSEGKTLTQIFEGEAFQRLRRNMLLPEGDPGCANCPIKSHHLPTSVA
jgi:MoaA/NifB/PqqE/SkfB family radical SAM enzyme